MALATGLAAVLLLDLPLSRRIVPRSAIFLAPAIAIPAIVYAAIAKKTGWKVLTQESFLFFGHVPWQLIHFNQVRFGFDRPLHSLLLMVISLVRLLSLAGILGLSPLINFRRSQPHLYPEIVDALAWQHRTGRDLQHRFGRFRAHELPMPIILTLLLALGLREYIHDLRAGREQNATQRQWLLIIIFALLSLMRIFLRVSTGGALSSVLIPASLLVFVYCWTRLFPRSSLTLTSPPSPGGWQWPHSAWPSPPAQLRSRFGIAENLPTGSPPRAGPCGTSQTLAVRSAARPISCPRSSMPSDFVAVVPEGTSLDFFAGRRNPLRDEILVPGMLAHEGEQRAIDDLRKTNTRFFLVANRSTREFGQTSFGRDYDVDLMAWVEDNFRTCAIFGNDPSAHPQVGDPRFFIRVYCRP